MILNSNGKEVSPPKVASQPDSAVTENTMVMTGSDRKALVEHEAVPYVAP